MTYLIEIPHNEEECLRALDGQLAKGGSNLDRLYFGCMSGDHTAYGIIDAESVNDAQRIIPDFLRDRSIITEIRKLTPDMIRSFHLKAA